MTTISPSSDYRVRKAITDFYSPEFDFPIVIGALVQPMQKQSAADGHGHPVSADIFSNDVLFNDPQNSPSHEFGPFASDSEEFEAIIPESHSMKDHILDHKFSGGSLFKSPSQTDLQMAQKRRSLQAILTPAFLHHSPPSVGSSTSAPSSVHGNASRMRSYSSAALSVQYYDSTPNTVEMSPGLPLGFFLDEDPFAKLAVVTTSSSATSSRRTCLSPPDLSEIPSVPRCSPLSSTDAPGPSTTMPPSSFPFETSPSPVTRTRSAGSTRARSAHVKPAFSPRPSLPSLHTLAQTNVVIPKKARKGRVGGNLPYEPWDIDTENNDTAANPSAHETTTPALRDLTPNANEDFLDFSDNAIVSDPFESSFDSELSSLYSNSSLNADFEDLGATSTDGLSFDRALSLSRPTSLSSLPRSSISITLQNPGRVELSSSPPFSTIIHSQTSPVESDLDTINSPPDLGYFSSATSQIDYSSDHDHELDIPAHLLWPSDSVTPRRSFFADVETSNDRGLIEKWGGSVRDSLPSSMLRQSALLPGGRMQGGGEEEAVDGSGWDGARGENGSGHSRDHDANSGGGGRERGNRSGGGSGGNYGGWNQPSGSGSGGGHRGNDGDGQRSGSSSFSTPLESDTSSSEDDQTSTDDYGKDSPRPPLFRPPGRAAISRPDSPTRSDDDVPLAQRIPTALRAQRTIRKQVRDERDQRRQERAARREHQAPELGLPRPRQQTLRPAAVVGQSGTMSSSQEAALHASSSIGRPRTKTLPGNSSSPFAAEELAQKLLDLDSLPPRKHNQDSVAQVRTSQTLFNEQLHIRTVVLPPQERGLRAVRSFHRQTIKQPDDNHLVPVPILPKHQLNRSVTTPHSQRRDEIQTSHEETRRPSTSGGTPRVSTDSAVTPQGRSLQRRPMPPPIPPVEALAKFHPPATKVHTVQQRIFIGDMQRFNIVEIEPSTNAGDVLRTFKDTGGLDQISGGGWMLWEVAQDFGMERPIRSFELLSDITASWNVDKLVNMFVLKATYLEPLLSRSAIPESSPRYGSWVQWESKRGKWNKRWMELREHSLWLSKRETGKDEIFLCSLSTFDAYHVTRLHKAPKPYVFAVKSTENLSLFENTADYVHIFSCSPKDGEKFMEKLLLARSYVLFQERNVLFNKSSGTAGLARSGTRKHSATPRPAQPLVQVSAPFTVTNTTTKTPFEPGSLLAKP